MLLSPTTGWNRLEPKLCKWFESVSNNERQCGSKSLLMVEVAGTTASLREETLGFPEHSVAYK